MGQQEVENLRQYPFFDHVGDCLRCFRAATVLKNDLEQFCIEGLAALAKGVPQWVKADGRNLVEEEIVRVLDRRTVLEQLSRIK